MTARKTVIGVVLLSIVSLLIVAVGCGQGQPGLTVEGSGNLETCGIDYSDFTKIETTVFQRETCEFYVQITQADSCSIRITADDNLLQYLDVEKRGDTLFVGLEGKNVYRSATIKAAISMPILRGLNLNGASVASVSGFRGSYDTGGSHEMKFNLLGASAVDINDVECVYAHFDISSASRVSGSITMATGSFKLSGASFVDLEGSGVYLFVDASEASHVSLGDFAAENAVIVLRGGSDATVNASARLSANLTEASILFYVGNPELGTIALWQDSKMIKK